MKKTLILLALLLALPGVAGAAEYNAASCSQSAVQAAINLASNGDTVTVPAGSCTWTSYVSVSKEITIQGAGIGNTIIHRFGFTVNHGVNNFRITGFTFDGDGVSSRSNWVGTYQTAIRLGQGYGDTGNKDFRIDHNRFEDYREPGSSQGTGVLTIIIFGYSYGVIDHNQFYDCRGEVIVYQADGSPAFDRPGIGGYTNGAVFIEDNSFGLSSNNYGHALNAVDGGSGARFVIRHNTVTDSTTNMWYDPWEVHGHCFGGNRHVEGSYSMEIYDNTYTSSYASTGSQKNFAGVRGGTGVIYGNTVTGSFTYDVRLINYRSFDSCTYGGLCESNEGYPCLEQIGAPENGDYYIWGNTRNGNAFNVYIDDWGLQREHIQLNRDYWRSAPPGGYTPYQYPHPLTLDGQTAGCGDGTCDGTESCKSCSDDCGGECEYPPGSLTNNGTMTANSGNFAETRPVENLWDGCNSTSDEGCTSGSGNISSFWIEFDLGQEYDLTQARLFGDTKGNWQSRNWSLLYKADSADSWSSAFSGADAFMDGWSEQDLSVTARYVRVEVLGNPDYPATQARELELYGTPHGIPAGLVGWWRFDEGSGTAASDSSGKGNDGTVTGASWTEDSMIGSHALSFDDVGDLVEVGTSGWSASQGSVALWARPDSFRAGSQMMFGHTTIPAYNDRIQVYTNESGGWLGVGLGDSHFRDIYIEDLDPGIWYHIALTWDGTDYAVYVDGEPKASGQYSGLASLGSVADIGNNGNPSGRSQGFNGAIDEVRIYDYALAPEEVLALFRQANPHRADTSGDGCVDDPELMAFISHFYLDSTSYPIGELMEAVGLWKAGAGCS